MEREKSVESVVRHFWVSAKHLPNTHTYAHTHTHTCNVTRILAKLITKKSHSQTVVVVVASAAAAAAAACACVATLTTLPAPYHRLNRDARGIYLFFYST